MEKFPFTLQNLKKVSKAESLFKRVESGFARFVSLLAGQDIVTIGDNVFIALNGDLFYLPEKMI